MRAGKMKSIYAQLLVVAFLGIATVADASEWSVRKEVNDRVTTVYYDGRFDELDTLHVDFRKNQERTPSGVWKLSLFYGVFDGFSEAVSEGDDFWEEAKAPAKRWMTARPRSAAAALMYANILQAYAWKFRGTSYAKSVPKENWEPFRRAIEDLRVFLTENKAVASNDPQWFVEMLNVARAQSWDISDTQKIVDEGTRKFPGYYGIYFEAAEAYAPRWGGSVSLVQSLVDQGVRSTSKTDGRGLYARIYWSLGNEMIKAGLSKGTFPNWREMKASIGDVISKYPDAWNYNHFAFFACLAGDYQYARDLMDAAKWDSVRGIWDGNENLRVDCFARPAT